MVKLFVATARLAWGQTSVITVKIGVIVCKKRSCMYKYIAPMGIEDV